MTILLLAKPGFNCIPHTPSTCKLTSLIAFFVVNFAAVIVMLTLQLYSVYVESIQRGQFLAHLL